MPKKIYVLFFTLIYLYSPALLAQSAKELNEKGLMNYKINNYEAAVNFFKEAIDKSDKSAEPYFNLGMTYLKKGEYLNAIDNFNEALELDPKYLEARLNLGNSYVALKNFQKANEAFKRLLDIDPGNPKALNNLGNLYKQNKEYDLAANYYQRAIDSDPGFPEPRFNLGLVHLIGNKKEEALAQFKAAEKLGFVHPLCYYYIGNIYYEKADFYNAAENYINIIDEKILPRETIQLTDKYEGTKTLSPEEFSNQSKINELEEPKRSFYLGNLNYRDENFSKAIEYYLSAVQTNRFFADAYYNLGVAYEETNSLELAIEAYSNAVKANERHFEAFYNLGSIYFRTGDYDGAVAAYRNALKLYPDNEKLNYNLANVLYYRAKSDLQSSVYHYEKSQLDRANKEINLAAAYAKIGNIERSKNVISNVISENPENAMANFNLGILYAREGEYDEANQLFKKASDLAKDEAKKRLQSSNETIERN